MAILEKEILLDVSTRVNYYEKLGYQIPKYIDGHGRNKCKKGTKILVNINDIPENSQKKVTKICDDCGKHILNQSYGNIIINRKRTNGIDRCRKCGIIYGKKIEFENIPYEKSLEYYAKETNKEYLLNEFSNKNTKKTNEIFKSSGSKFLWNCSVCKSEYPSTAANRVDGRGCPYCAGLRINLTNCLWTTHPNIARLLKYHQRGYEISFGSNSKEDFICSNCSFIIKNKQIPNIIRQGLSCPKCSDGISYPEKFMFNMLEQLNIEFEVQKKFDWSDNKRYDFFVPSLNCIIETHGNQHYADVNFNSRGRSLEEEQENDSLKEKLAKDNGIEYYIVIDCRKSQIEYIKNNIENSILTKYFNINNVEWFKCHESACKSFVRIACDLWESGIKSTKEIGIILKLTYPTVIRYLKQGASLGWCDYNPREVLSQVGKSKGKKVIQLSNDLFFIKEWSSATEASEELSISRSQIPSVCSGKRKTSGGFKWMYKEDYDQYIKQAK